MDSQNKPIFISEILNSEDSLLLSSFSEIRRYINVLKGVDFSWVPKLRFREIKAPGPSELLLLFPPVCRKSYFILKEYCLINIPQISCDFMLPPRSRWENWTVLDHNATAICCVIARKSAVFCKYFSSPNITKVLVEQGVTLWQMG